MFEFIKVDLRYVSYIDILNSICTYTICILRYVSIRYVSFIYMFEFNKVDLRYGSYIDNLNSICTYTICILHAYNELSLSLISNAS